MSTCSNERLSVLLIALLLLPGCGGGSTPAPAITGITVQAQPSNQTAYSGQAAPQNQVSFTAYDTYSDLSISKTPITNVQWTGDGANWVSLNGNMATCTQSGGILFSTVTATAQVNGNTYTASSGLYCV
jgi:hypothetical protein